MLAFGFTFLAWCGESAAYYFILKAFGLSLPIYASVMLMAIVNQDVAMLTSLIKKVGTVPASLDEASLSTDVADFVGQYATQVYKEL